MKSRLIILLLLAFTGHLQADSMKQNSLVFTSMDYPPFVGQTLENHGPLAEILMQAFQSQNFATELVFHPWVRAMSEAKSANVDGMIGVWHTPERAEDFLYSDPILPNKMGFYKNKNTDIIFDNYAGLAARGYVLGMVRGYVLPKGLKESGIEIVLVSKDIQNFKMLAKQRIDLVVVDKEYARYVLRDLPKVARELEWIEPVLEEPQQYLIISKTVDNAQQKIDAFNKGLKSLHQSGDFFQILKKHGFEY